MTATELYEIVKDHKDVWGEVLAFCDYSDASYWASRVIRGDYSIQCSDATASAALLGLGVEWLTERNTYPHMYIRAHGVNAVRWEDHEAEMHESRGPSSLDAVYAAIAGVKRGNA